MGFLGVLAALAFIIFGAILLSFGITYSNSTSQSEKDSSSGLTGAGAVLLILGLMLLVYSIFT
jgi:L-asparagine transporter-like permease